MQALRSCRRHIGQIRRRRPRRGHKDGRRRTREVQRRAGRAPPDISGYFDITHGAGLAIITPRWMKEILSNRTLERFVTLGIRLFEFDSNMDKEEMANKVIDNFYQFFLSIGIPMHLKELGVDENRIEEMAKHILQHDSTLGEFMYVELDEAALIRILKTSM